MAQSSYQQIDLNSDLVLDWPFSLQNNPVVTDINNVAVTQIKLPCYAASTENLDAIYDNGASGVGATLTSNGVTDAFTIDGVMPVLGARILIKDQDPLSNANGIYTLTIVGDNVSIEWELTRSTDYDTVEEIQKGDFILVTNGVTNTNTQWTQTATIISVGISSPTFINIDDGWGITMPDATLVSPGQNMRFNNIGLISFRILAFDGVTEIANIESGDVYDLYLNDNSISNGVWNTVRLTDGSSSINSVAAQSSDNSVNITGSPLSPPGGILDFQLPASISNVVDVGTPGVAVITETTPDLVWNTRSILGGTNIGVSDGDGVAGNPTINLDSAIVVDSVDFASGINIATDIITNELDGNVNLETTGIGKVNINGVTFDTNGTLQGVEIPSVYFTFTDTLTPSSTIVIEDQSHVASITGSGGIYTINFSITLSSENYGVFLGLGSNGGATPFVSHAFWTLRTPTSVVIAVVDASGVLVQSVPDGISGMVMLAS